jgi:hypothetical protein
MVIKNIRRIITKYLIELKKKNRLEFFLVT